MFGRHLWQVVGGVFLVGGLVLLVVLGYTVLMPLVHTAIQPMTHPLMGPICPGDPSCG